MNEFDSARGRERDGEVFLFVSMHSSTVDAMQEGPTKLNK